MKHKIGQNPPNFIIGGTAAGGTSYLSSTLIQNPEIYLPIKMRPEPHFFYKTWEFEKGPQAYLDEWFNDVPTSAIAIGERSSSYLFGGKFVAERIFNFNPKMKLIFTLRNPIERTWANYRYTVLQGLEELDFSSALKSEEARIANQKGIWSEIQPYNYTGRGFYGEQLQQYLEIFPRENILILKSEFLSKNPENEFEKIHDFLLLSKSTFKYDSSPDHVSLSVNDPLKQTKLREYFNNRFDFIIEGVRREENIERFIENDLDKEMIGVLKDNLLGIKRSMNLSDRTYLQHIFAKDIKKLNNIVDFDTSDWI